MKILFILLVVSAVFTTSAQITFEKTFGGDGEDRGNAVIQTRDGGYFIAGFTNSYGTGGDVYGIKTHATGDTVWTRYYGGDQDEVAYAALETSEGHIVIGGVNSSYHHNDSDMFLLKIDGTTGDTLWNRVYAYTGYQRVTDIDSTFDGGYILAGYSSTGYSDFMLRKVDSTGMSQWSEEYGPPGWTYEYAYGVKQTSDSGYVVIGNGVTTSNQKYLYLVKTDASGDTMWTRILPGDYAYDIVQTPDNGFVMVGRMNRFLTGVDIYLVRTDANGDTLWTRKYGTNSLDIAWAVQMTNDDGFIITGESGGSVFILKAESNGDSSWMYTYGTQLADCGNDIQLTDDGGYIITGVKYTPSGNDVYLIKTNPDGLVPIFSGKDPSLIENYLLYQNYPNPFNPTTTIGFDLPRNSEVTLKIFNILGEEVTTLLSGSLLSGSYKYEWDASELASGMYFYILKAGDFRYTRKMLLMK